MRCSIGIMSTQWLENITNDSMREVSRRIGKDHSAVHRAANSQTPPPRLVRDVAREYGHNPITALRDAGFLTPEEVERYDQAAGLAAHTTTELLLELLRREQQG